MKMILFNQNPMIAKLLESVSKKLELSIENFNHYQELSAHLKKDPEWLLIADDECLEKLDQVDWLELKETISQNKNSVCMYKKGNEAQPFLEGFEMKIKKPFLPTEMLKVLQKKLGSNISEPEPSQNLDPTQEVLETNWDELENLGDLEVLAKEEPNNEEQLLPTLDAQEEKEEVKQEEKETPQEEKEEVKETPQEEKPKDDETQEGETPKDEEVSKKLETQEKLEIPKEETQEEVKEEIKEETQEEKPIKEETQENKEEKQEETQDSPSAQELEAMQELVKEIQENSNGQENKEKTQENAEIPQDKEIQEVVTEKTQVQELEVPKEKTQESAESLQETQAHELEKQEIAETPQDVEVPQSQEKETPQEKTQEKETPKDESMQESAQNLQDKETPQEETQEDHYESIEDIPEPVMAKAMGEELPFLNESVAKTPNNENDTETPKESVTETSKNENTTEAPQEKEESDKISSPLELRLNLQDLLKSLNQESLKSLLENKTLSIKIALEDKKPNA
ncbi:chemotaxis regulatory protein ChePep [Helicobacter pylori]|uniref:chemotaxis regulatory protein ChePep n=1 Tax=Helicobacter pylori TaxID=210 RepID=UPI001E44CE5B|nr:chemotaxis regulatory protein ChePep [Helicobacter pylori]